MFEGQKTDTSKFRALELLESFTLSLPTGRGALGHAAASHKEKSFLGDFKVVSDSAMVIVPSRSSKGDVRTLTVDYLTTRQERKAVEIHAFLVGKNGLPVEESDTASPSETLVLNECRDFELPTDRHREVFNKLAGATAWFGRGRLTFPKDLPTASHIRLVVTGAEGDGQNSVEWVERVLNSLGLGANDYPDTLAFLTDVEKTEQRLDELLTFAAQQNIQLPVNPEVLEILSAKLRRAIESGLHPELLRTELNDTTAKAISGAVKHARKDHWKAVSREKTNMVLPEGQYKRTLCVAADITTALSDYAATKPCGLEPDRALDVLKRNLINNESLRSVGSRVGKSASTISRMMSDAKGFLGERLKDLRPTTK